MTASTTIELLTERTEWVLALARHLVGDAHQAEDVAQEATLAALAAPGNQPVGLGWLAGVVRNVAASMRRQQARQARRDAQRPTSGEAPSAAHAAAFVEQQRLLADVVLQLDAPFRDVVLLRFFEALPQREIARRLGVPVATVNTRLTRALSKLRAQLDARHRGERRAWVMGLAPLALRAPIEGNPVLGVLAMKKPLIVAALVASSVGVSVWVAGGRATSPPDVPATASMALSSGATSDAGAPRRDVTPTSVRSPVAASPKAGSTKPRVRVVDASSGTPQPDADVRAYHGNQDQAAVAAHMLRRGEHDDLETPFQSGERLTVDAEASVPTPDKLPAAIFGRHGDRMGMLLLRGQGGDEHTLRLWPVHTVRARVVDANGRAMRGVPVVLRASAPMQTQELNLQDTDHEGVAALRWYEAMRDVGGTSGRIEVALGFPGGESVFAAIDAEPRVIDVRLTCPAAGRTRVLVAANAPLPPRMYVVLSAVEDGVVWAKPVTDGCADFWPVGVGARMRAGVAYGNRGFTTEGDGPTTADEVVTLPLDVGQVLTFVGRVMDGGQPGANLQLTGTLVGDGEGARLGFATDDVGRFRVEVAATARATGLELRHANGSPRETPLAVALPAVRDAQPIDLGDLHLTATSVGADVEGTVVDDAGATIADAKVHVVVKTDVTSTGWQIERIVECDAEGRFSIPGSRATDVVWLQACRSGPWRHEPERPVPGANGMRLVMQRAGALSGRLRVDDGVNAQSVHLSLWDEGMGPVQFRDMRGWTFASVDAVGKFDFSSLRPSSYTLAVALPGRVEKAVATIEAIRVGRGEATRDPRLTPVDLRGLMRALTLRVRDERGHPLRADAFAISVQGKERRVESLGVTDRPLLLTTDVGSSEIIVEADDHFAARVEITATDHDVVLRRGTPVAVRITGATALDAPLALRASLLPVIPTDETRHARGYRHRFRPDHALIDARGHAALRVPVLGDYRLRLVVQRNDGGTLDEVDVTPAPAPVVHVADGSATLAVFVDGAAIAGAIAEISSRKR